MDWRSIFENRRQFDRAVEYLNRSRVAVWERMTAEAKAA